jgi:hypothetical protein
MEKSYLVCYVLNLSKVFTNLISRDKNIAKMPEELRFAHIRQLLCLCCCCCVRLASPITYMEEEKFVYRILVRKFILERAVGKI